MTSARRLMLAASAAVFALGSAQHTMAVVNNVALGGKMATQSSTDHGGVASRAVDGNTNGNWGGGSVTHTNGSSNSPWWRVDLGASIQVEQVIAYNRTDCCGGRFSDIVMKFYDANNNLVATSPEFNDNNGGSTNVHATPGNFNFTLAAPTLARYVEVARNNSSIFGNSAIAGDTAEDNILSLAEVQVFANNIAQGKPATQSSEYGGFPASNAVNGNLGDFTHTASGDSNASLKVDLLTNYSIDSIILHNRDSCCGDRLRDITVDVLGPDGMTILATSGLLNPANTLGSPAFLAVDFHQLLGHAVVGTQIRVRRTASPGGGDGNNVLSLGELQVFGNAIPEPMTAMLGLFGLAALATRTGRRARA